MIKVDFHLHSQYSPDSISGLEDLYDQAKKKGLGKLVITDHNTIRGAVKLQRKYPDFVIVGEEIKTTKGEILAFFLTEEVPVGLEPADAFKRLKDQGAFISLSHPFAFSRYGWSPEEMIEYMPYLDAIETRNSRNRKYMNRQALDFAHEYKLAGTAGSDAHAVHELGTMGLELPEFNDADSLRIAINNSKSFGNEGSITAHLYSRYAVFSKKITHIKRQLSSESHA